jgi:hypothetical protein
MTYTAGGLIQATDYNGFVGPTGSGGTAGANLNDIWGVGATDKGWGQTAVTNVSTGNTVTATQWASLVNNLATSGTQTNTTLTSRSAPTAGTLISVLANVNADLTSVTTNRGNAAARGTQYGTWTGSIAKTGTTGTGQNAWTLTWTQTVTFADAASARYFWNAGGLVRLDMSKTSNSTDIDPDWNTFVGTVGTLYLSGRVNSAAQTIAGTSYTGFTRIGGSGTPGQYQTTTGWYSLTPGAASFLLFQLNNSASPYTGEYITVYAAVNAGSTVLTLTTNWVQPAVTAPGTTTGISGGSDTASPSTTITGTAPTVLCTYYPPSSTYLTTASWGTPTIASSIATG